MTHYINIFTNNIKELEKTEIQVLNELLIILFNFFLFQYDNFYIF